MNVLNNTIKNFDPNAKIGEIFIVDIEFTACYDARKKCTTKFILIFLNQK